MKFKNDTKLYHGDCLDIMPTLTAGSVDAIITDLPYGTTECLWDEVIPFVPMWEQVKQICKGAFITTSSQPFTSKLIISNSNKFREEIIWEKERPSNIFMMGKRHGKTHENIIVFSENGHTYNAQAIKNRRKRSRETMQKYVGNKLKHGDGRSVTSYRSDWDGTVSQPRSVLYFVRDIGEENHPTQKPVALYEYLIRTYTNAGETVLDICMGSGTTGVAAIQTGRNFIGIEKEQKYFEIASRRIAQAPQPLFTEPPRQPTQREPDLKLESGKLSGFE